MTIYYHIYAGKDYVSIDYDAERAKNIAVLNGWRVVARPHLTPKERVERDIAVKETGATVTLVRFGAVWIDEEGNAFEALDSGDLANILNGDIVQAVGRLSEDIILAK